MSEELICPTVKSMYPKRKGEWFARGFNVGFLKGYFMAGAMQKNGSTMDYGFGKCGFGIYVYDEQMNILFYIEDKYDE